MKNAGLRSSQVSEYPRFNPTGHCSSAEFNSLGRGFQHAFLLIYALVTECCLGALVALALTRTTLTLQLVVLCLFMYDAWHHYTPELKISRRAKIQL